MIPFRILPELSANPASFAVLVILLPFTSPASAKLWFVPEGTKSTSLRSHLSVNALKPTNGQSQEWIIAGAILSGDFSKNINVGEVLQLTLLLGEKEINTSCTSNMPNYCYLPLLRFKLEDDNQALRALLSNNSTATLKRRNEVIQDFRIENEDAIIPERFLSINTRSFKGTVNILGVADGCPDQLTANWFGEQNIFAKELKIQLHDGKMCTFRADEKRQPFMDLTKGESSKATHSHSADREEFKIKKLRMQFFSDRKVVKVKKSEIR